MRKVMFDGRRVSVDDIEEEVWGIVVLLTFVTC